MGAGELLVGARLLHYAAVLGLFGAALFPLYAFPPGVAASAPLRRRLRAAWQACAALALASGLAWLMLSAASMGGDLKLAVDPDTLSMVAVDTAFGQLWITRMAVAALLAAWLLAARPTAAAVAVLSGLLLVSLAGTGHAAAAQGPMGWLHRAASGLHLLGAGGWLGALLALGLMLRPPRDEAAPAVLVRFAGAGSLFVAVVLGAGVLTTWLILGGFGPLLTTTYGRLLLVKIALVAAMLALAAANRFRLAPALAAGTSPSSRLRLTVGAELALGAAVLAIVAVLGTLDPQA